MIESMIRIAAFGTIFFRIAKLINEAADIRIEVYIYETDYYLILHELDGSEDWLHTVNPKVRKISNLLPGRFWKAMKVSADLYLLSDDALLFAFPSERSKAIFLPIGYDLTTMPFPTLAVKRSFSFGAKIKMVLIGYIQRSRIRVSQEVWASPFPVFLTSLKKIRRNLSSSEFMPIPLDFSSHNAKKIDSNYLTKEILGLKNDCFLVFCPGRLMITKNRKDLVTGQTKGTDKAIRGFLKFSKIFGAQTKLILIDNQNSPDRQQILDLVSELNAEPLIHWVKNTSPGSRLSNLEMANIYAISDVVLGDFGSGWFGQTGIEAGAHKKPFITCIEDSFMKKHFDSNPFLIANSEDEIALLLKKLFESPSLRQENGKLMGIWYGDYFSNSVVYEWFRRRILASSTQIR